MILKWFCSATVRQATELKRQVRKLVNTQRDLLSQADLAAFYQGCQSLDHAIQNRAGRAGIRQQMESLETTANEKLLRPRHPGMSDNLEQLFVGAAVILTITTFFIQLFKIPTGSMQPTLYGILPQRLDGPVQFEIPGRFQRFYHYWVRGMSYYDVKAAGPGQVEQINPPKTIFPFIKFQKFFQGGKWHTLWFPPENLERQMRADAGRVFQPGENIIKLKVTSGDHLFVDRLTYNFRRLKRGEIVVFKTRTIPGLPQDQLYIKRLVGLSGETLRIGNDRHLIVNGDRLDAATPRFENVYSFTGPAQESQYSGHLNEWIARQYGLAGLAPLFPTAQAEVQIGRNRLMAMGDNTLNSLDSRTWGDFPQESLIGKFWFVYWPISARFGWTPR